jgi:hypothetical protein
MCAVLGVIGPNLGGAVAQGRNSQAMHVVAGCFYPAAIRVLMARHAGRTRREAGLTAQAPSLNGLKTSLRGGGKPGRPPHAPLPSEREGLGVPRDRTLESITAIVDMACMRFAGRLSDKRGVRVGIVAGFGVISLGRALFIMGDCSWSSWCRAC